MVAGQAKDFFISYTRSDRDWARWIAVQLEQSGFTTVYQEADFHPGNDFMHEIDKALATARQVIAVLSPAYLRSDYCNLEWRTVLARDPSGEHRLLIPVRVEPCEPPSTLTTRIYVDLFASEESAARSKLLSAIARNQVRPHAAPFPGTATSTVPPRPARFPGRSRSLLGRPAMPYGFGPTPGANLPGAGGRARRAGESQISPGPARSILWSGTPDRRYGTEPYVAAEPGWTPSDELYCEHVVDPVKVNSSCGGPLTVAVHDTSTASLDFGIPEVSMRPGRYLTYACRNGLIAQPLGESPTAPQFVLGHSLGRGWKGPHRELLGSRRIQAVGHDRDGRVRCAVDEPDGHVSVIDPAGPARGEVVGHGHGLERGR